MDFITLFFTTALVFVFQKLFQFVWDKFTPENKTTRKVKKYGKK